MKNKGVSIRKVFWKVFADIFQAEKAATILMLVLLAGGTLHNYLLVEFVDGIISEISEISETTAVRNTLLMEICVFLLAILISAAIMQCYYLYKIRFHKRLEEHVNVRLKEKLANIQYLYFEDSEVFEKLNRVEQKAVTGYQEAVESVFRIIEILFFIILYVIYLSEINMVFAVLVTGSILFSGIIATRMSKTKHKIFVDVTDMNQKRDYLNQIPGDKVMHQEYQSGRLYGAIFDRYKEAYTAAQNGYMKIHAFTIFSEAKALLCFCATMFGSYLYLSGRIIGGGADAEVLVALIIIFDQLYGRSERLSYYISNRVEELLVVEEYFEILDYREMPAATEKLSGPVDITLDHVSYRYQHAERKALNGVSVRIKKGQRVAVVGKNGSGKTTFCNILLGLLTDFEGSITIGDHSYDQKNPIPAQMMKSMSQDFSMYQTSIRENILFEMREEHSDEKMREALEEVGMERTVDSLADKSDTHIGQLEEGGIELSKGQEQKIAIARLLVNDAPIWILDEPTAYLDPLSEIDIYQLIHQVAGERTVFFVSHRLGFAPMADRILVFEDGKIVEDGSHEELLEYQGIYGDMYLAQKSWYQAE